MKKLLLVFALTICQHILIAQVQPAAPAKGNGHITGIVLDSLTRQPVPFATIALVNPENQKPIDGAMCDEKGLFSLTKVAEGTYKISVSFIGYKTAEKFPVTLIEKNSEINVGTILISTFSQQLKEVTVVGQKELIEEKVDRTVYNAEQDATTKGGDATDVLKRVPMLSVDLDGNVSLRGSSNIKVLINNKPSTITAGSVADALKQIPADQIKSVEVITSPSAKYDAEGSGGIINIILKKNNMQGVSLNVDASAGLRGSNFGLNGSYKKGKTGLSLGGFGRGNYNTPGTFENRQETKGFLTTQTADTRNKGVFGRYNFGWDYDINKYNSITTSIQYGVRNQNTYQDHLLSKTHNFTTLSDTSTIKNVNTKDLSGTVDVSVNYTHTFKKPQREFSLLTLFSRNNRTNDFINDYLTTTDLTTIDMLKNRNKSYNQEFTVQADYQTPIGTKQLIEFGGKNIMRKVSSDYKYYKANGSNEEFAPIDTSLANVFNYNQNITSGYLSYTLNAGKGYSFKVGSRYEYTTIDAHYQVGDNVTIPSYGVLVPSINISKKLKAGNMIKFAYNRRIQRPSIQFLNPNVQASNSYNITQGNPHLSYEKTNNFEFAYSTYIKSTTLNFSTFVRNTNNSIQAVRDTLAGGIIRTSYSNIGRENAYGFSVFANINIGTKFTLNGGTDVYYADLKNNVADPLYNASNHGWVASFRLFGGYNFDKGWGLQFFSFYRGRQVQLQGYQGNFRIYSLSLKKDFNQKKGTIGFGAENFFASGINIKSQLTSPLINQSSTTYLTNLSFKINFSYRIGKMTFDNGGKRKKSVSNDDLKEGEGGNDNGGGNNGGGQQQRSNPKK